MNKRELLTAVFFGTLILSAPPSLQARSKLNALPGREKVTVNLANPAATLVEEERVLTLQEGLNQVDFSWKGVNIDPDSIRLTILGRPGEVRLLSVSYPPNEAALVWQVYSPNAAEERVRISYLISGLDRLVTYKAAAARDESALDLQSYLVLRNFSGEDFERVRLLLDYGADYTGSVAHEETKETLLFSQAGVPVRKILTWDAGKLPWDPEREAANVGIPMTYELKNQAQSGLGLAAMAPGRFRVYQEDGRGSTIFLGEDDLKFTPVGKEAAVYLGDSREIVVTQQKMRETMINIRRPVNAANAVVLYDSDEIIKARIENFKDQPLVLTLIEHIPGQWDMVEATHQYELKDAGTLKFEVSLKPKEKVELTLHYIRRNLRPDRPRPITYELR